MSQQPVYSALDTLDPSTIQFIADQLGVHAKKVQRLSSFAPDENTPTQIHFTNDGDSFDVVTTPNTATTLIDNRTQTTWALTNTTGLMLDHILVGDPDRDSHDSAYFLFRSAEAYSLKEFPLDGFDLSVAHFNDFHSFLEPTPLQLTVNGQKISVNAGGVAALATEAAAERKEAQGLNRDFLFLNAGDFLQGTQYFEYYHGLAEAQVFNLLGLDAVCLGNHEFSLNNQDLARVLTELNSPALAANLDIDPESPLAPHVLPYLILNRGGERIGVVGLTTTGTFPKNPADNPDEVRVTDPIQAAQTTIDSLKRQGVDKIIVLSHLGTEDPKKPNKPSDQMLARRVGSIDLIVGGHSHTVLGEAFNEIGIKAWGPYPIVVQDPEGHDVPIVQAGKNGQFLGNVSLLFDDQGDVVGYSGENTLIAELDGVLTDVQERLKNAPVVFTTPDPVVQSLVSQLTAPLIERNKIPITSIPQELRRGINTGPGVLMADALLEATQDSGVLASFINVSGVRADIPVGPLTYDQVYKIFPFSNPIIRMTLTGAQLETALQETIYYDFVTHHQSAPAYVAGLSFTYVKGAAKGSHIQDLKIRQVDGTYVPVDRAATYTIVTNDFLANGGNHTELDSVPDENKQDTNLIDTNVVIDFLSQQETVQPQTEQRITIKE